MTDADDFNRRNIEEFRANHGRLGGQFEGAPVLLLHSTGARSGEERVNPMMYLADGDRYLVFASAAGADSNPAWYWNLRAHPDASIEVGDEHVDVRAVELTGAERDEKVCRASQTLSRIRRIPRKNDPHDPGRRTGAGTATGWVNPDNKSVIASKRSAPPMSRPASRGSRRQNAQPSRRRCRTLDCAVAVNRSLLASRDRVGEKTPQAVVALSNLVLRHLMSASAPRMRRGCTASSSGISSTCSTTV
jgi:deazaflavin-dependent oxidoreductase (nitroreductase family)